MTGEEMLYKILGRKKNRQPKLKAPPFVKQLRIFRVDNNISMYDMAHKLGLSASFMSSIENGEERMTKDLVDKLVVEYDIPVETERLLRKEYEITQ